LIDFHTHTFLSDGVLCPAELVQRAKEKGYRILGIADHADFTNIDWIIPRLIKFCEEINSVEKDIKVVPGVELTYIPPVLIGKLAKMARKMGAKTVLVHGETIVESVPAGTNLAALNADIDILAHPGLIKEKEVELAAKKGIYLEISTRKGHCLTNGRLVYLARKYKAKLVIGTDTHEPEDLITKSQAEKILLGAGLNYEEIKYVFLNGEKIGEKIIK